MPAVALPWSQAQILAVLGAAAGAVCLGVRRQPLAAACFGAAATVLACDAWTRRGMALSGQADANDHTRAALGGSRGLHVRESVRLDRPVEEVYRYWRQLENLPRFMRHVERVTESPHGFSHWVARGPGGVRVEWDAEIINDVPNRVIGWRSIPGSDLTSAGSVQFADVRNGRSTHVTVHMQYAPPAGKAGAFLATVFGRNPASVVREDLRRLKQSLEAEEDATVTRSQTDPAR
jgi:uncharacterized membrane protein